MSASREQVCGSQDKSPGQGHWPTNRDDTLPATWLDHTQACHCRAASAAAKLPFLWSCRQQDRGWSVTAPFPRDETGSFLDATLHRYTLKEQEQAFLPRCVARNGLHHEKHESVYAGWILNYSLEGRVQKIITHRPTHANTLHRMRRNSLQCRLPSLEIPPSVAESL